MQASSSNTVNGQNTLSQNVAYSLPKLALYFLVMGPMAVMPGLAVKYFGLSLAAFALAQVLARSFDAITDPLTGYYSDHYYQRRGTRKPLMIVGGMLALVASTMLYIPYGWDALDPEPVSFAYFLFFYMLFTLAWTLVDIPHLAWGADISSDAKSRSQRFSFRTMATFASPILFFSIPLLPIFETTEVTPETLEYAVYIAWMLMPLCLWVGLRWVPNGPTGHVVPVTASAVGQPQPLSKRQRAWQVVKIIVGNRPLLVFYAAYALIGIGFSMSIGLVFFFIDNYLGIAEKIPYAFMVNYTVCVPAAWFWGFLIPKIGARNTWAVGLSLCALGLLGIGFISPGEGSFWPYLACSALMWAGYPSCFVAGYTILASIADYGKWKFDQECNGLYFSVRGTIAKFNGSVGVAIGLLLAGWLGFDPLAAEMSEDAIRGLRFSYIVMPLILISLSIIVITRIPLSTHQQSVIRKRLTARVLRTNRQTS